MIPLTSCISVASKILENLYTTSQFQNLLILVKIKGNYLVKNTSNDERMDSRNEIYSSIINVNIKKLQWLQIWENMTILLVNSNMKKNSTKKRGQDKKEDPFTQVPDRAVSKQNFQTWSHLKSLSSVSFPTVLNPSPLRQLSMT